MAKQKKQLSVANEPETVYLTKRILLRAIAKGSKHLQEDSMNAKGFLITEQDGWLVKKSKDGSIERIKKLAPKHKGKINLD